MKTLLKMLEEAKSTKFNRKPLLTDKERRNFKIDRKELERLQKQYLGTKENLCVQCHREMEGEQIVTGLVDLPYCEYPDCPNYGLLQAKL